MQKTPLLSKKEKDALFSELQKPEIGANVQIVHIGENRKQFFIRIPSVISKELNLKKTDKMKIFLKNRKLEIEVMTDGA